MTTKYVTLYQEALKQYNFLLYIRKFLKKSEVGEKSEYLKIFKETEAILDEITSIRKDLPF